ncbi:DNA repair protein xrcc2 [Mortierella polycephala]|uniref:DNA repair protein xrcc2 n=1 Tax=Mortierella polycephala TaxID=41804 RepID=A0A9P6Q204_9FUNG|nr:DNA repair protein xrcc2 [Mortierella polycephala]
MHLERVLQIEAESGLDFIHSLNNIESISSPAIPAARCLAIEKGTGYSPGYDLSHDLGLDGIDPILERYGPLQPGDMIDFHGQSCSGKTLFLYAIIISTILPNTWKYSRSKPTVTLSGKSRSVLFMDMDQGFSVNRLKSLLRLRIISKLEELRCKDTERDGIRDQDTGSSEEIDIESPEMNRRIEALTMTCLANVHVFRPPDAVSAIVYLRTMDQYLSLQTGATSATDNTSALYPAQTIHITPHHSSTPSQRPPFALLMIDSLSSFYWQERAQSSHGRYMTLLVDALQRLVPRWKLVFITTSWSIASAALSTDWTVTDALRMKLRYRFLMQSRDLQKFRTEADLLRAWTNRQDPRLKSDRDAKEELAQDVKSVFMDNENESGSLFQAQMVIPSSVSTRPELFRFSISNTEGVLSFKAPENT